MKVSKVAGLKNIFRALPKEIIASAANNRRVSELTKTDEVTEKMAASTDVPAMATSIETPSMKSARIKWEDRQQQRKTQNITSKFVIEPRLECESTLVTDTMCSEVEEESLKKLETCISGASRKTSEFSPKPASGAHLDQVHKSLQYETDRINKPPPKRRGYKQVKPYFKY